MKISANLKSHQYLSIMILLFIVVLCSIASNARSQSIQVNAKLTPSNVMVGEKVIYTVTVASTGSMGNISPEPPELSSQLGFSDFSFVGTQNQTTIINGAVKSSVNYNYVFVPTQEGTFTIPPSSIKAGSTVYKSAPTTLTVSPVPQLGASPANAQVQTNSSNVSSHQAPHSTQVPDELKDCVVTPIIRGNPELQRALTGCIILKPDYNTLRLYQGEQTYLSYHLLIDADAMSNINLNFNSIQVVDISQPEFKQFLKDEIYPLPQSLQFTERIFGNKTYKVAPLFQVALTPTKTGELSIEPFKMRLLLRLGRSMSSNPFDIFDDFGFGGGNVIDILALSPVVKYTVNALPTQNKSSDFSGTVGEFSLTATVDKATAKSNDDIVNLQLVVSGQGDAATISAPEFVDTNFLKLLEPPKSNVKKSIGANNTRISTKTFDYLLRPITPGKALIPEMSLSVFNTQKKDYETIRTSPLPIEITTGTLSVQQNAVIVNNTSSSVLMKQPQQTTAADIAYLHEGVLKSYGYTQTRYYIILLISSVVSLLLIGISLILKKRNSLSEYDIKLKKSRSAISSFKSALSLLKRQINNPDTFYDTMGLIIRQYFADKLQIEALGLTTEEIENQLYGVDSFPQTKTKEIIDLLEVCDGMKYTNSSGRSIEAIKKDLINAKQLIETAEKYL